MIRAMRVSHWLAASNRLAEAASRHVDTVAWGIVMEQHTQMVILPAFPRERLARTDHQRGRAAPQRRLVEA
ncbi:MAG: hypothetical protein R3B96_20060 [Pirellulaceae bacterium]